MPLDEFNVILGIYWMARHKVVIDFMEKIIQVRGRDDKRMVFYGNNERIPLISMIKARKLMCKGSKAYLEGMTKV